MTENSHSHAGEPGQSSHNASKLLNSILELSAQRQVTEDQITIILHALAAARDPALLSRFPAVLAICIRRGIGIPCDRLLGSYWESSPRRQNLEKLLLISAVLFQREGIVLPHNLAKTAASLASRHPGLSAAEYVQPSNAPPIAVADMQTILKQFAGDLKKKAAPPAEGTRRAWSPHLGDHLDRLFSEKQKELVLKKLEGQHLTKTEREYYSRTVKKKLAAIADKEIQEMAALLGGSGKGGSSPPA
jgi:hypothetical protein